MLVGPKNVHMDPYGFIWLRQSSVWIRMAPTDLHLAPMELPWIGMVPTNIGTDPNGCVWLRWTSVWMHMAPTTSVCIRMGPMDIHADPYISIWVRCLSAQIRMDPSGSDGPPYGSDGHQGSTTYKCFCFCLRCAGKSNTQLYVQTHAAVIVFRVFRMLG